MSTLDLDPATIEQIKPQILCVLNSGTNLPSHARLEKPVADTPTLYCCDGRGREGCQFFRKSPCGNNRAYCGFLEYFPPGDDQTPF